MDSPIPFVLPCVGPRRIWSDITDPTDLRVVAAQAPGGPQAILRKIWLWTPVAFRLWTTTHSTHTRGLGTETKAADTLWSFFSYYFILKMLVVDH